MVHEEQPPPTIRSSRRKPIAMILCGVAIALAILIVAIQIDSQTPRANPTIETTQPQITELIEPEALSAEQLAAEGLNPNTSNVVDLPEGGGIQITNEQGELTQWYRFERLEPNPPGMTAGWMQMQDPVARLFMSDGRIIHLIGDSSLVFAPNRALEEGRITGNVVIHMYDSLDELHAENASLICHTDEASFDNIVGEVRSEGDVTIESPGRMYLPGRDLTMLLNDQEQQIHITIAEYDYLRLYNTDAIEAGAAAQAQAQTTAMLASRRGAALSHAPPVLSVSSDEPDDRFYKLSFESDVRVRQPNRLLTGDRLSVVFSSKSKGLGKSVALGGHWRADESGWNNRLIGPQPMEAVLAQLAIAQTSSSNSNVPLPLEGETIITSSGPLVIDPVTDPAEQLDSAEDARLHMIGSPVRMHDETDGSSAACAELFYNTLPKRVELVASAEHIVRIDSPDMVAEGQRFFLVQSTGEGGMTGLGWLEHQSSDDESPQQPANEVGVQNAPQPSDPAGPPAAEDAGPLLEELRITWTEGVDLKFDDLDSENADGVLKYAEFRGNVEAISQTEGGSIFSDVLQMNMKLDENGESVPDLMIATGNVKTVDPERTAWADRLEVTFRQIEGNETDLRELEASGDVQVLLTDGGRVFCDLLKADGVSEIVHLLGENVVIVNDQMLIDHGSEAILRKGDNSASMIGGGRARIFNRRIDQSFDGRIPKPVMNEQRDPPRVTVKWSESARYDNNVNDGAGAISFKGNVDASAEPSELELNTMTGEELTLEFVKVEPTDESQLNAPEATNETTAGIDQTSDRQLAKLIAKGDAKLENRSWLRPEDRLEPGLSRVFYVAGEHVEYDDRTLDALVLGKGTVLIRDELAEEDGELARDGPFGSKGRTLFGFNERLEMHRKSGMDNVIDLLMSGDVEGAHISPQDETTTITCEQLEATIERDAPQQTEDTATLALGGDAELLRIYASGNAFIRTPQRDVQCETLDYNVQTMLAEVQGSPQRRASVLTRGAAYPLQAQRFLWNMDPHNEWIRIERPGGVSGR